MPPAAMVSAPFEIVTVVVVAPATVDWVMVKLPLSDWPPTVSVAPGVVPDPIAASWK